MNSTDYMEFITQILIYQHQTKEIIKDRQKRLQELVKSSLIEPNTIDRVDVDKDYN